MTYDTGCSKIIGLELKSNYIPYKIKCILSYWNCICCVLLAVTNVSSIRDAVRFLFLVLDEKRSLHNKY